MKITRKQISYLLTKYGKVSWAGGYGYQYVLPLEWQDDKYCFKYLIFAYGKKQSVVDKMFSLINERTGEELELSKYVEKDRKIPISCGAKGMNCF